MNTDKLKEFCKITKTQKLLYVEDNEHIRIATLGLLNNFFKDIDIAVDGADGLKQYSKDDKFYDLVITDINMPNMCGVNMSKAIFKIQKSQKIIMITAFNDKEELEASKSIGIDNYIHKPIKMDLLIKELEKVLL